MQAAMESCPGKLVMSGVMGFGLGGVFGQHRLDGRVTRLAAATGTTRRCDLGDRPRARLDLTPDSTLVESVAEADHGHALRKVPLTSRASQPERG